ncbi:PmoA family protein [Microbacterium sp. G2-8]|uniref:DUF6807 domain-containing protein n=1 Tax=Microbacterium sp. G2-8 TaxID=2842454 RepID=UPI001C8AACF7|nr:PmoA family protein [Microbacterium sp. G2-8]
MTITTTTADGRIEIAADGAPIATYEEGADIAPFESPKPYLHPVRTRAGEVVTDMRPADHVWHKGLQFALTDVAGRNFWGGNTYVPGRGYEALDVVGRVRRDEVATSSAEGDARIREQLSWVSPEGSVLLTEQREQRIHAPADGLWAIDLRTSVRNVSGRELELGSPTTKGRPDAGYTGWILRLAPSFHHGSVIGQTASGAWLDGEEEVRGAPAHWALFASRTGSAAVLALAGRSTGPRLKWFARSEEYPALGPSTHWDEPQFLGPRASLDVSHRFVVLDETPPRDEAAALAERLRVE